jgi:hypothetical protein
VIAHQDEGSAKRRCVFCDAEIETGTPPEHVHPKWLRKFLDKGEVFTHGPGTHRESRATPAVPWGKWQGRSSKSPLVTVETVCRSCNHHWMSNLETWTSPLLTSMIEGKPQGLDLDQQVLVSRWATKSAMVWDQLVPGEARIYTTEECRWAKEQIVPPPDTTVRLGHYTGTTWDFLDVKHENLFWEPPSDPKVRPGAHRTLMVMGKLVIDVAVRRPDLIIKGFDIDDALVPIWPTAQPRSWPPRLGLNDKSLEALLDPAEPG